VIKRLKPAFAFYNFFQYKKLKHNLPHYKKIGLRKWWFSPVSSLDFEGIDPSVLTPSASDKPDLSDLPEAYRKSIEAFDERGYCTLPGFFSVELIDKANEDIDRMLFTGEIRFKWGMKIMFAWKKSKAIEQMGKDERLMRILTALLGHQPVLFQSINFLEGSQQHTHSDSIHMTTFPLGGLIAGWVAMEDVEPEQGALHYYPGSHKLPYYLNGDYDNHGNALLTGTKGYDEYERFLARKIEEKGLKKEVFRAKKGDILIWHANLMHGGEPHTDKTKTRKSTVFHYFDPRTICYHEITQRPALMDLDN
jgi:phytanoyl-CoA hydroxylase